MRDLRTPLPYVQVKGGEGEKEEGAWGGKKKFAQPFPPPTVCSPSEERGGGTDGKKAEARSEEQNIFPDRIAWFVISQLFFRMFPPSRAAAPLWAVLLCLLLLCVVEVRVKYKKIFCVKFFMHAFIFF